MNPATRQIFTDAVGEPGLFAAVMIGLFIALLFLSMMYLMIKAKNEITNEGDDYFNMFTLIAKMLMLILAFAVIFRL